MQTYRHTEVGYALVIALASGMAVSLGVAAFAPEAAVPALAVAAVLGACVLLLPSLTAEVTPDNVQARFGFGLIRRTISLGDISGVGTVRSSWVYGWGIRKIPRGWLWNVASLDAVELKLRSGKVFWIGTDDAEGLRSAVAHAMSAPAP